MRAESEGGGHSVICRGHNKCTTRALHIVFVSVFFAIGNPGCGHTLPNIETGAGVPVNGDSSRDSLLELRSEEAPKASRSLDLEYGQTDNGSLAARGQVPSSTSFKELRDIKSVTLGASQPVQADRANLEQNPASSTQQRVTPEHGTETQSSVAHVTLGEQTEASRQPLQQSLNLKQSAMAQPEDGNAAQGDAPAAVAHFSGSDVDRDADGGEGANKTTVVEAQDLVASVKELCDQDTVEQALELVRTDLRNVSAGQCGAIMEAFAAAERSDCALAALLHMQVVCVEVGATLDTAIYNGLMLAYARDPATASDDGIEQAFAVLDLMERAYVKPDITTFNRLMEACSAAAEAVDGWEWGLKVLDKMKEYKLSPDVDTYNTLLEACGKCGWSKNTGKGLEKGAQVLERMHEDGVAPTTDTFNILMYGCAWAAGAGDGWRGVEQGLDFLSGMAELSAMPDVITFNNLIAACAQAAGSGDGVRAREQAFRLLETMRKVGLAPDQGTCDTLIATCAKAAAAGDPQGVSYGLQVLEMVYQAELDPDPAMYNALIGECVKEAEAGDSVCGPGWHRVAWTAHVLALMSDFGPDLSDLTRKMYNQLRAVCLARISELAQDGQEAEEGQGGEVVETPSPRPAIRLETLPKRGSGPDLRAALVLEGERGARAARAPTPRAWGPETGEERGEEGGGGAQSVFVDLRRLASAQLQELRAHKELLHDSTGRHTGSATASSEPAHPDDDADPTLTHATDALREARAPAATPGATSSEVDAGTVHLQPTVTQHTAPAVPTVPLQAASQEGVQEAAAQQPASQAQQTAAQGGLQLTAAGQHTPALSELRAPQQMIPSPHQHQHQHQQEQQQKQKQPHHLHPQHDHVPHLLSSPGALHAQAMVAEALGEMARNGGGGGMAGGAGVRVDGSVHYDGNAVLSGAGKGGAGAWGRGDMSDGASLCTPWAEDQTDTSSDDKLHRHRLRRPGLAGSAFGGWEGAGPVPGLGVEQGLVDQQAVVLSPERRRQLEYLAGQCMVQSPQHRPGPPHTEGRDMVGLRRALEAEAVERATRSELKKKSVPQVVQWLREVGLGECTGFFEDAGIDGAGLVQLRDLQRREMDVFYEAAEKKLGIHKFGLVLKLADALQGL